MFRPYTKPRARLRAFSDASEATSRTFALPARQLLPQPLVILEGSYSHHPLLAQYESLRVFVTCSKAEQTYRLQAREGERYPAFAARWIPLEEGYFAQYGIEAAADFVVDTTAGGTI